MFFYHIKFYQFLSYDSDNIMYVNYNSFFPKIRLAIAKLAG